MEEIRAERRRLAVVYGAVVYELAVVLRSCSCTFGKRGSRCREVRLKGHRPFLEKDMCVLKMALNVSENAFFAFASI